MSQRKEKGFWGTLGEFTLDSLLESGARTAAQEHESAAERNAKEVAQHLSNGNYGRAVLGTLKGVFNLSMAEEHNNTARIIRRKYEEE